MPSTQLTKGVSSSRMGLLVDKILSFLEKVSDEAFWNSLFGDRVLNLMKRYFGSDVLFLGIIVYLAPILGYQVNSLFYYLINKVKERMYVSIQISKDESGYDAIQQFIVTQTASIRDLRDVEGRTIDDKDEDMQLATPPPTLHLYPLNETEHKITYKNHTLWVVKKKNSTNGPTPPDYFYGNSFKEMLGMMSTSPCIQITMKGQDLNLLKNLIQEWINDHFEKDRGKLTIYKCLPNRYDMYEWRSLASKDNLRSLDSVILKDGQKELLLKDIQNFRKRERWYNDRGIPYRRGYLLYGPPGTGKTSLVQSVASKANMNIAIISLSGKMTNDVFNSLLDEIPHNSILLMEDIDHCVVKNDGKEDSDSKISMSALLNALDGVVAQEGSMIFMTCNDVNRVQPALLRPGRIDVKMELGFADKSQISQMFWRFMDFESYKKEEEGSLTEKKVFSEKLMSIERKFTEMIPNLQVTPAELQNFFIMNLIDCEDSEDDKETDYSFLLDKVPEFLAIVKRDREHVLEHDAGINSTIKAIQTSMGLPNGIKKNDESSSSEEN